MAVSSKAAVGVIRDMHVGWLEPDAVPARRTRPRWADASSSWRSLLAEAQGAFHQRGVTGKGAEECVLLAGLEPGHVDRGGVTFAAADQLGVRDDAAVARLFVAV